MEINTTVITADNKRQQTGESLDQNELDSSIVEQQTVKNADYVQFSNNESHHQKHALSHATSGSSNTVLMARDGHSKLEHQSNPMHIEDDSMGDQAEHNSTDYNDYEQIM